MKQRDVETTEFGDVIAVTDGTPQHVVDQILSELDKGRR